MVTGISAGYLGSIATRRTASVPPLRIRIRSGYGNWTRVGREFRDIFVELGGLQPRDHVLEIGCGFGRIAGALAVYLSPEGSYEGIDIIPEAIDWCQTKIGREHPNFRFRVLDVRNEVYNPNGAASPEDLILPFPSDSFDFVCLTSVFTHMLPAAVQHYLHEVSRVLRTDGHCVITYFLLDDHSSALQDSGKGEISFSNNHGTYRVENDAQPERAVAYDLRFIQDLYRRDDLRIAEPIRWGSWSGRRPFLSVQDVVVAEKVGA